MMRVERLQQTKPGNENMLVKFNRLWKSLPRVRVSPRPLDRIDVPVPSLTERIANQLFYVVPFGLCTYYFVSWAEDERSKTMKNEDYIPIVKPDTKGIEFIPKTPVFPWSSNVQFSLQRQEKHESDDLDTLVQEHGHGQVQASREHQQHQDHGSHDTSAGHVHQQVQGSHDTSAGYKQHRYGTVSDTEYSYGAASANEHHHGHGSQDGAVSGHDHHQASDNYPYIDPQEPFYMPDPDPDFFMPGN
uniref:Uncharacterized protein n=1 Tax=Strigamia maritima TaxID=126957 RepID=T1J7D0_STRMM